MHRDGVRASPRLSVLLLADYSSEHANTVQEHIAALSAMSRHDVHLFNPRGVMRSWLLNLDAFDAVVVHYSIVTINDHYLSPSLRKMLRHYQGLKVQIIQDDYRWVDSFTDMIQRLGISVLFTLVPERELDAVWKPKRLPGVERITTLAGYVPAGAEHVPSPPLAQRPFDIVYRGRTLPFWLGRLGQDKIRIAQGVLERAPAAGLKVDVDWREDARIYGNDWNRFLASGRATLGTESGSSITDFDGSLQRRVDDYVTRFPQATYEDVHEAILAPHEGNVMMNVISPRIFEAIAARTALVLFPGEYSGILERDRHYIGLEKDFSNWDEIVERLRNLDYLEVMAERAHAEVIASRHFDITSFVERLDRAIDEHATARVGPGRKLRHQAAKLEPPVRARAAAASNGLRPHIQRVAKVRCIFRVPPRGLLDPVIKTSLALLLGLKDPQLRRLPISYLRSVVRSPQQAPRPVHVLDDLLKLALLNRFRVGWQLEDGVLTVVSLEDSASPHLAMTMNGHTSNGRILKVLWDHRARGGRIPWPLPIGRTAQIAVGLEGVHHFRALSALGAYDRSLIQELVLERVGVAR